MGKLSKRDEAILAEARVDVKRNEDGGADEESLLSRIEELDVFDVVAEKRRRAQRIVDAGCKPDPFPDPLKDHDQVCLPGFEPYNWEPDRLIKDDDGHIIEQKKAKPNYKEAAARRSQLNTERIVARNEIEQTESRLFSAWWMEQVAAGRDTLELGFQDFAIETGYLRSAKKDDTAAA